MSSSSSEDLAAGSHGVVRFFKVILQEAILNKRLMLPAKFTRQHGDLLHGRATLSDPNGLKWELEIYNNTDSDTFWFRNGWEQFAKFYSLTHGDLLVFEYYCSSSEFSVMAFDGETQMEVSNYRGPCFKHELTASYFQTKQMPIPQGFYERYMEGEMMVKVGCGGKVWEVEIISHGVQKKYRKFGYADWKRFMVENSVETGDVCVLELVDDRDVMMLLQVHIFRSSGN